MTKESFAESASAVNSVTASVSPTANGDSNFTPLKIIVAGGGIGGFTAALALRRQGHHVELYEQSRFLNEVGAAIHMVPNAVGLLRRLGVDVKDKGAVLLEQTRLFKHSGELFDQFSNLKEAGRWQNPWYQAHRAHLHKQLKDAAIATEGAGEPVIVHTSSKIIGADAHKATVYFANGTPPASGDLVVGADGVHSATRAALAEAPEHALKPYKTHASAMRFLIPREKALADPDIRELLASAKGSMDMWYAADRKVVIYPCVNNTLLNFVCVHPAELSDASDDYNKSADKDKLLDIYANFEPRVLSLLRMADPETLKVYPLFDMDTLPTFVNDRLALIGDAAHPFTPHLAQGGAQAIEDAVSLGVMLPLGTKVEEIPDQLKLYNQARYERATTIQNLSRHMPGPGEAQTEGKNANFKLHESMDFALSHDEHHFSTNLLRQHRWSQNNVYWRMPTAFGPMPGPRQTSLGQPHDLLSSPARTRTAIIKFKTSATLLRNLFPPGGKYSFVKADTVATASFCVQTLSNLAWLGGGSYDLLALYVHGVQYKVSPQDRKETQGDQEQAVLEGSYCPVMFENLTDPILSGREELGVPKVYSDISISGENEGGARTMDVRLSWRGAEWASFRWEGLHGKEQNFEEEGEHHNDRRLFLHKSIPSTGRPLKRTTPSASAKSLDLDADYDVVIPGFHPASVDAGKSNITESRVADKAQFAIHDLGPKQLPTLHHIIARLAEVPVFEIVEASVVDVDGLADLSAARRIS